MATLSRKFLEALGLNENQIASIVERHSEVLEDIKKERDDYKTKAESADEIARERDRLKNDLEKAGDASKVQAEFDAYKNQVNKEKENQAKLSAVKSALKAAGVQREEMADLLMGKIDLDKVEMDGENLKNGESIINPLKSTYAGCFGTTTTQGTPPAAPPTGGGKTVMSRTDIFRKENGKYVLSTQERQAALAQSLAAQQ